jgi:hypothetical protein
MTPLQKYIIECLMEGYTISTNGKFGNRLRTPSGAPVRRFGDRTLYWIKRRLMRRENKTGLMIIDKRKVRSLHGNCLAKKIYKQKSQKASCA